MADQTPDNEKKVLDVEVLNPDDHSYRRVGNASFGPVFAYSSFNASGCAAPAITLFLFLVMLGQYGLLAAIGFIVFYTIGSILGSLRLTRQLVLGMPVNPWPWRVGNWFISFLITIWLAGGAN